MKILGQERTKLALRRQFLNVDVDMLSYLSKESQQAPTREFDAQFIFKWKNATEVKFHFWYCASWQIPILELANNSSVIGAHNSMIGRYSQ